MGSGVSSLLSGQRNQGIKRPLSSQAFVCYTRVARLTRSLSGTCVFRTGCSMTEKAQRWVFILFLLIGSLWVGPRWIPAEWLKETLESWVTTHMGFTLQTDSVALSLFPTTQLVCKDVTFSGAPLPFSLQTTGTISRMILKFSMIKTALTGRPFVNVLLDGAQLEITPHEPPKDPLPYVVLSSLFIRSSDAVLTLKKNRIPTTLHSFQIVFEPKRKTATLQGDITLPEFAPKPGSRLSTQMTLNGSVEALEDGSLYIPQLRFRAKNFSYVSLAYQIKQGRGPFFMTASGLSLSREGSGTVKSLFLGLNDHTLQLTGQFQTTPFRFIGRLAPFETTFKDFPFELLQDTFPGASGIITLNNPIGLSYTHSPKSELQMDLKGIALKNLSWPTPWFLLEEPEARLSGKLFFHPKAGIQPSRIEWRNGKLELAHSTLLMEISTEPDVNRTEITLQPFELDLSQIPQIFETFLGFKHTSGLLTSATPLTISKTENTTALAGRLRIDEGIGTWQKQWQVAGLTADMVLGTPKSDLTLSINSLTQKNGWQLKNLTLQGNLAQTGVWELNRFATQFKDGTVVLKGGVFDPIAHTFTAKSLKGFFDLTKSRVLNHVAPKANLSLTGNLRFQINRMGIPLTPTTHQPKWHKMVGAFESEIANFSWRDFDMQTPFTELLESYYDQLRTRRVRSRTLATETIPTLETTYKGTMKGQFSSQNVIVSESTFFNATSTFTLKGKTTKLPVPLQKTRIDLNGTYIIHKPGFADPVIQEILLDPNRNLRIPVQIQGTLGRPDAYFLKAEAYRTFDRRIQSHHIAKPTKGQ